MNNAIRKTLMATAVAGTLATAGPLQAEPLAISEIPLSVSSSVQPNVMLLIDDSGSMDNIIWAEGFDPTVSYPYWGGGYWSSTSGNVHLSSLPEYYGAGGNWFRGYRNGSYKYLRLPDPVGYENTRYSGNYLNYLFSTYDNWTDLSDGDIPDDYRMNVARDVARQIVTETPGMRFGVSSFNYSQGGSIDAECGAPESELTDAIDDLYSSNWTPLAESFYEVTRYFRGLDGEYDNVDYTSPIQYRCQKNFSIVITDGYPTYDTDLDSVSDPDDGGQLPDWDGEAPATDASDYPNFPQYSDGFGPDQGNASDEGYALFLDDVAKFAWDIDFITSGTDDAGVSYEDPAFDQQHLSTYTVGFATSNQMLEDAAEYGHARYYTADNAAQLTAALQAAIADILARLGSSSSAASNTGFVSSGARVYQARFNSTDWSGELLAFDLVTDPTDPAYGQLLHTGTGPDGAQWEAGNRIDCTGIEGDTRCTNRHILTFNAGGVPFRWDDLGTDQRNALGTTETRQKAVLNYLRGDQDLEGPAADDFRPRDSLLGDIVHSSPRYVAGPNFRYPANWPGASPPEDGHPYADFRSAHDDRDPMLYVGANDGMLHAFDAITGDERLAYVPSPVIETAAHLADPDYGHRFSVDGTPTVIDAFFDGAWHSVLAGGLNKGGQGIYALDVSDPDSDFTEAQAGSVALWEFTDADDADLGYTYSQPAIARMANGQWAVIFGNGYNNTEADGNASSTGHAVLYIAFIGAGLDGWSSGDFIKIDTGSGSVDTPNGLATVAPIDLDGNHVVDAIYAGDLRGNLWKFDVDSSDSSAWGSAFTAGGAPRPLFTACSADTCSAANRQPITTRPEVGRAAGRPGVMVYFGTGKYLETTDSAPENPGIESFYGIHDPLDGSRVDSRSQLLEQEVLLHDTSSFDTEVRVTSDYPLAADDRGWYLDLTPPGGSATGERQVTNSVLRAGRIIFTTLTPGDDPCVPGGRSWLMELDPANGGRLGFTPFDLDGNRIFDQDDYATITEGGEEVLVPVSGEILDVGGAATPSFMAGEDGQEFAYISGDPIGDMMGGPQALVLNPGGQVEGRQSWTQPTGAR